ncbi:MAG: zinc ribbon domain-containing protein [Candidatus Micrarchaeota archaeon]|nr:zinc ribbon domain-containing protein [Candidatus Micrarchaeota archaeon]
MAQGREISSIKEILGPTERISAQATQRRWGPGGDLVTPVTLIATENRLIVINRTKMGMKIDYEIVQYPNIVSAKLINGFISSSIIIRVRGYKISPTEEISGFVTKEAKHLIDFINKKIGSAPAAAPQAPASAAGTVSNSIGIVPRSDPDFIFCQSCGGKNLKNSKFCSSCGKWIEIVK